MNQKINIKLNDLVDTIKEGIIRHTNIAPFDYDNELTKHTYIEFRLDEGINFDNFSFLNENRDKLWEEHGCVPELATYVDCLKNVITQHYSNKNQFFRLTVTEKDFKNISTPFFTTIQVIITGSLNDNRRNEEILGGYMYSRSGYVVNDNNELTGDYNVCIIINEKGETFDVLVENICKTFAHELTHAYDDYKRKTKQMNGEEVPSLKQYSELSGQKNTQKFLMASDNDIEQCLSQVLYFTNKIENNGFIGGLKQELRQFSNEISDTQSGVYALKKTETWQEYEQTKENLDGFIAGLGYDDSGSLKIKDEVCAVFKNITNIEYNYQQIVKYLEKRFWRTEKKLIKNAYKQIFDVYKEKNDNGIIFKR